MFVRVLLSAILGSIIAFAWLSISWMYLPYHGQNIHQFKNEAAIVATIKDNINKPGVYHFPSKSAEKKSESVDQQSQVKEDVSPKTGGGPAVFVNFAADDSSMTMKMLMGYAYNFVAAFLISLMMLFTARSGFFCRLGFVVLFAATIGVLGAAPLYVWWQFDIGFVALEFMDYAIAWGLAGFVMAMIVRRKKEC